jgi:hypothetical protein
MNVPAKTQWKASASSGDATLAIDDRYATGWVSEPSMTSWLEIDLGREATLGGIEVYWGRRAADVYAVESSLDGRNWASLCHTRHGEGGQNVFAFPPTNARYLRLTDEPSGPERVLDIVEINVYGPEDALKVLEPGRIVALGQSPVTLLPGESITADFGYIRPPIGALIEWGESYGTVFSVHLSDDGERFREVGRITTSSGNYDNFYWRSTVSRYFRLTVHETSSPQGAIIKELKLRILNKDRMPIGQLERAALAGPSDLSPQSLLGRQVYWTALGEFDHPEQALFDEYGNLEAQAGFGQLMPLIRLGGRLQGAPGATDISHRLAEGSLPIPTVQWSCGSLEIQVTALAHGGEAWVEYRLLNTGSTRVTGSLVLAVRPVQINPYWQHGGHAIIKAVAVEDRDIRVNDRPYARLSQAPDTVTLADFDEGDVVTVVAEGPRATGQRLQSLSGLLSAALEFEFELESAEVWCVVAAAPMRDDVTIRPEMAFDQHRQQAIERWRQILGPRRIEVGDREVSDTVEAQTALILVNATQFAFKPGPRHYDRTWIRDGSSQALALLWAGLVDEAKRYVRWYAERIYDNGMVPPILNPDGSVNRGYGSDIEFDAQGEFVTIAADIYHISRDGEFLRAIYEPVVRATRFIEVLCAETNAQYGPESRFHGLVARSISHEGYNKPSFSYWDDFFALSAWRNCADLARAMGDAAMAAYADTQGQAFAVQLNRSLRLTADAQGNGMIPASADREDVDPTSTSIAFEPCRVDDVIPHDLITPTYDNYAQHLEVIRKPDFAGGFTPYEIRNLNAFVALGRYEDAFGLLNDALNWRRPAGWRHWAEVLWGDPRAPEYIGDMPHTWIGAEFATAVRRMLLREHGTRLELFRAVPEAWWAGEGIRLNALPTRFGVANLRAERDSRWATVTLSLTGPLPEQITVRYPGARRAFADDVACTIEGDLILAPHFNQLSIEN